MARENWAGSGQLAAAAEWFAIRDRLGPTEFTGYDEVEATGEVLALVADGARSTAPDAGETVAGRCSTARPSMPRAAARPATSGEIEWDGGRARGDRRPEAGRRPASSTT